ncbi:MAG TPA: FtsX-like permease family protein, partial [Candidatus Sulfopaludibacter sp.]|nr:FtsX-like permease family protein [Candidatus Sulfopaludibacter sp.]
NPLKREALRMLSGRVSVNSIQTGAEVLASSSARTRFVGKQLIGVGILALLLLTAGIYSVVSFDVSHRAREMAIRVAVGSTQGQVLSLVVRQSASLIALGIGLGLLPSAALGRALKVLQLGASSLDVLAYTAIAAVIVCAGIAASYSSARNVVSIDPIQVLRSE